MRQTGYRCPDAPFALTARTETPVLGSSAPAGFGSVEYLVGLRVVKVAVEGDRNEAVIVLPCSLSVAVFLLDE